MSGSGRGWDRLCDALGQPDWKSRAEWKLQAGRARHRPEITEAITALIKKKPTAHWMEVFEDAGVPCGPINTIDQVFADPQVRHLGMAAPVESPTLGPISLVASPLNMSGLQKNIRSSAPGPGSHTEEVLRDAGYSPEELRKLESKGAI